MTTPKKREAQAGLDYCQGAGHARAGNDVPVAQGKKSLAAVVHQHAKSERLAAQTEVFAGSVLQQGETKDQPGRPQNQQEDERQRSEVAKKILAPRPRRNAAGELRRYGIQVRR